MRVLTWNLWWRYGPWEQRREAIAATLADLDADLCGLQEVWAFDGENLAAELAGRLDRHWCWAAATNGRDAAGRSGELGNAILSRWPITDQDALPLPVPDSGESRVAVHARVESPEGVLPMFTTHLTYRPGGSAVRSAQVRALAPFVAARSAGCDYPPVVTGDLNAEPDSDELRLLGGLLTEPVVPGPVLIDAWRYADPGDPGFTWDRRNGYQAGTVLPDSRIDYVLVGLAREPTGGRGLARPGRGRVRSSRLAGTAPVDGVWPSDHFAVVTDLY
jgi:endonuclease/exonuclease/phosphatase family metal-dependent hydrolase